MEDARITRGTIAGLEESVSAVQSRQFTPSSGFYDVYLAVSDRDQSVDHEIWLRLDANDVKDQLNSFVWRIVGLVILISLFVTVACLLFLTPLLVKPLRQLNRLLLDWQSLGIHTVSTPRELLRRSDELGTVCQSFEQFRTELVRSEAARRRISIRFQYFADMGADIVWEIDHCSRITYLAGDVWRIFQFDPDDLIGLPVSVIMMKVRKVVPQMRNAMESLRFHGEWEGVVHPTRKGNERLTLRVIATPFEDADGRSAGLRGTIVDVTLASELRNELQYRASHDVLTGLLTTERPPVCRFRFLCDRDRSGSL